MMTQIVQAAAARTLHHPPAINHLRFHPLANSEYLQEELLQDLKAGDKLCFAK